MTPAAPLKAPYPYSGGKSRIAPVIWDLLGDPRNYCEPFFGSGAVLFARPHAPQLETVNDRDGFICCVWSAIQHAPDAVAYYADWPANENDLHARHAYLVQQRPTLPARLEGDPAYYDAKVAGWWCWGLCCWIGSGWCSGVGPWHVVDGQLVQTTEDDKGIWRKRPHLGTAGQGVKRRLPHLGNAGQGVHRQRPHLGAGLSHIGNGVHSLAPQGDGLYAWMQALCERLRRVRVCCGDWTRVLGPSVTWKHGLSGIMLDPPYSREEERSADLYAVDDLCIAHEVRAWCLRNGNNPLLRIVLCGYDPIHDELLAHGWGKTTWTTNGGYGNQSNGRGRQNGTREAIWYSPHCIPPQQLVLPW